MFHKTFKRAVYIGIGACAAVALIRPPTIADAATPESDAPAVSAYETNLDLDPTASAGQPGWQAQQAGARYASWSAVFMNPPR